MHYRKTTHILKLYGFLWWYYRQVMFSYDIWIHCTSVKPTIFMTSQSALYTTKTRSSRITIKQQLWHKYHQFSTGTTISYIIYVILKHDLTIMEPGWPSDRGSWLKLSNACTDHCSISSKQCERLRLGLYHPGTYITESVIYVAVPSKNGLCFTCITQDKVFQFPAQG